MPAFALKCQTWKSLTISPRRYAADAQAESLQPRYQYVWSARYVDSPVLRDENTDADDTCDDGRVYYLTDALGNVTTLVSDTGVVLERYVYDPYGQVTIYNADWSATRSSSSYENTRLYTGREFDPTTGLYYYRARWYDTGTGNFTTRDPLGFAAGDANLYRYVGNRPVGSTDPSGLLWRHADGSSGALPEGAVWIPNPPYEGRGDWLDSTGNFFGGYIDVFTGKLSRRYRGLIGDRVDYDSGLYLTGQITGTVNKLAIEVLYNPCGASGTAQTAYTLLQGAEASGHFLNAGDKYDEGDALGMAQELVAAGNNVNNINNINNPDPTCFVAGTPVVVGVDDSEPLIASAATGGQGTWDPRWWFSGVAAAMGLAGWRAERPARRRKQMANRPPDDPTPDDDGEDQPVPPEEACLAAALAGSYNGVNDNTERDGMQFPIADNSTGGRRWWLAGCLMVAAVLAGRAWSGNTPDLSAPDMGSAAHAVAASAGPSVTTQPIETIRVGQRVVTHRTAGLSGAPSAPTAVDPAIWRLVRLRATEVWPDGTRDVINVETLQPPAWISTYGAQVGAMVPLPLDLVEMGLPDTICGEVIADEPCPAIGPGPGRVVLTTVNHLNPDVWRLTVTDKQGRRETIRPTGFHRFWSETRQAYVSVRDLQLGETLDGVAGRLTVQSLAPVPGTHRVYNMTVEGDHVYRVATRGVLVHNVCEAVPGEDGAAESWEPADPRTEEMYDDYNWGQYTRGQEIADPANRGLADPGLEEQIQEVGEALDWLQGTGRN